MKLLQYGFYLSIGAFIKQIVTRQKCLDSVHTLSKYLDNLRKYIISIQTKELIFKEFNIVSEPSQFL